MNFNEKLLSLRKAAGISQDTLAQQLGVSRQAVSKWELGTAMPETKTIILISRIMDISIDELMDYSKAAKGNDIKSIFKKYSGTLYFIAYEICTVVYMLAWAHISIVFYSIIRHTLGIIKDYGISWNLRYLRFVVRVNIDNLTVAILVGITAFMLTRYIRKKDSEVLG